MYIRLNFDYNNKRYFIPTATDGTVAKIPDNHPMVSHFNEIKPPHHEILPNYPNIIYSIQRNLDYFKMPFSPSVSYWIKV